MNLLKYISFLCALLLVFGGGIIACDDNFDEALETENKIGSGGSSTDPGTPVPGNGGVVTISRVSSSGCVLSWKKADDDNTSQGDLLYRVYGSKSNALTSVENAEKYGSLFVDWTADLTMKSLSGLSSGTIYYFAVLVKDTGGKKAAYNATAVLTETAGKVIYVFNAGLQKANLGGRAGVDKYCFSAKGSLPVTNVKGFISIDNADDIAAMATGNGIDTYTIVGPSGIKIADSWAGLTDTSIDYTLKDADIITGNFWWSGSLADGEFDSSENCSGWTSTSGTGRVGGSGDTDSAWIYGKSKNCTSSRYLLCIGW
ncbi:MAG: fibronectin type III domain-containing protein [bacterium]|nr:fibronectin type III domain-containing protein [bacterium]